LSKRAVTAFGCIFSIKAISLMVRPFIIFISDILFIFFNISNIAKLTSQMLSGIRKKNKNILRFY
jgi:hypothetical protein